MRTEDTIIFALENLYVAILITKVIYCDGKEWICIEIFCFVKLLLIIILY